MGHYSNDADSVRVDFFKDTGKWYTTEAVKMAGQFEGGNLIDIFERALYTHLRTPEGVRLRGMWAVCLAPYHEHEHPLMRRVPSGECQQCGGWIWDTAGPYPVALCGVCGAVCR